MEYKLPKTLTLDYKTWRCGGENCSYIDAPKGNKHGTGSVFLLNEEGYMCCLGQFSLQAGIPKSHMREKESPTDLLATIKGLTNTDMENTKLSEKAININDDPKTSIPKKIHKLQKLFRRHDYTIKVKNLPKTYKEELSKLGE